ncbi:hypothetical protein POM88_009769 [Heracleum sosnowskyi]|uniref:Uncharacterized protein n=1 Tax=Heracleum sosnowskyi TaxID=360622 RepID=A0AAD8JA03_9APIA|nr:hypothetical protein POM88_009769 [Heracleum sosnowskyi]
MCHPRTYLKAASAKKVEAAATAAAGADYLPLEGGPARKIPVSEKKFEDKANVLYIGRIQHGFYEDEMEVLERNPEVVRILFRTQNEYLVLHTSEATCPVLRNPHR